MAVRSKEVHFPAGAVWLGGRRVSARVAGKPPVDIVPPPEYGGTAPATWSPEDLLVAAAATCLAVTFAGVAARRGAEFAALRVDADGVCGVRPDGRYGFVHLTLRLEVDADAAHEVAVRAAADQAKRTCLVTASLDVPTDVEICVGRPVERVA